MFTPIVATGFERGHGRFVFNITITPVFCISFEFTNPFVVWAESKARRVMTAKAEAGQMEETLKNMLGNLPNIDPPKAKSTQKVGFGE